MSDFSKDNNTAKVTFSKDYKRFKKGETAYMHLNLAKKLADKKVAKYEKVDVEKLRKQAKIKAETQNAKK